MTKPLKQIHLAAHFPGVNNTTVWSDPEAGSHIEFSSFVHLAQTAERAKFDFFFLAEGLRLREQGGEIYDLDEAAVEPPKRPVKPIPAVPARDERADRDRPRGLSLSIPVLVGGALCVALLSILGAWGAVRIFRGPAAVGEAAAASNPAKAGNRMRLSPAKRKQWPRS